MIASIKKPVIFILTLWVLTSIIWVNKAFHIDDTFHIEAAQHITNDPFHPMSGEINWSLHSKKIHEYNQPPLVFYLIAITGSIFGFSEVPLHILISFFSLGVLILFHKLILEYNRNQPNLGLMIILGTSIPFIINQNVMTDMPMLFFILGSFFQFKKYLNHRKISNIIFSMLFLSGAVLTKYTALPFLGALILYGLILKDLKLLRGLSIPILILMLWSIGNYLEYGGIHLLDRPRNSFSPIRIIEFISCLGASVFLIPLFLKNNKKSNYTFVLILTSIIVAIAFAIHKEIITQYHGNILFSSVFILNGVISLFLILKRINTNATELILPFAIMIIFIICFAPFQATRHILLLTPFMLLFVVNLKVNPVLIIFSASLGILTQISDYAYANSYRTLSEELITIENKTHYSLGHWGWQHYSTKAGLVNYDIYSNQPKKGDLIYSIADIPKQSFSDSLEINLIDLKIVKKTPYLLISASQFGSLYNTFLDRPSWSYSTLPNDTLRVYEVK